MKHLITISILVVLFCTSCRHDSDDSPPLVDTLYMIIPIWDTVFLDAEYIDVSEYGSWNSGTHFDTTVVHDGSLGVMLELFGFPILFQDDKDTEFKLMGGFLEGERGEPVYIPIHYDWYPTSDNHELYVDTLHEHMNWYPSYVITQLESESEIIIDTFLLDSNDYLFGLHDTRKDTQAWHWKYDSFIMNFPAGPSPDKLLFKSENYEVYFTDILPYSRLQINSVDFSLAVLPRKSNNIN